MPINTPNERSTIEEKANQNEIENNSEPQQKSIEETVAAWQIAINEEDAKSKEDILQQTCKYLANLDDLETRLNEHRIIETHLARHGTADNRRRKLLHYRSEIREKTSSLMQTLKKMGMTEEQMYEQLPFVGKCDIQQLIQNEP